MGSMVQRTLLIPSQCLNLSSRCFSPSDAFPMSAQNPPSLVSLPAGAPTPPLIYCGRGDKKTAKGKRFRHSFGNARPRDKKKGRGPPRPPMPSSPRKKDGFDDDDC